jgi:hypothetical protein
MPPLYREGTAKIAQHECMPSLDDSPSQQKFRHSQDSYASSHSKCRGSHPRIRLAFSFEAPLSLVA